jgi:hypothetical protein
LIDVQAAFFQDVLDERGKVDNPAQYTLAKLLFCDTEQRFPE